MTFAYSNPPPSQALVSSFTEVVALNRFLQSGGRVNAKNANGLTLLGEAIKYGNEELVTECLKKGASVSGTILIAARNDRVDMISALVSAGANVNEPSDPGWTPLRHARRQSAAMRSELERYGAHE